MITKQERKQIKKVLGHHYTDAVLKQLLKDNVLNKLGRPHSKNMIRVVFNGERQHEAIEEAIFKAFSSAKQKQSSLQKRRKSILNT